MSTTALPLLDSAIRGLVDEKLAALEQHLACDVAFYYGQIHEGYLRSFRDFVEQLRTGSGASGIALFLNTPGGSVEAAEQMVRVLRHHYPDQVSFVVPDAAMSAGTILCMSGDRIYMDYSSALGPIDPQVFNGREWVPALGYLDQVERMLEKDSQGKLTNAELLLLRQLDLALLRRFEQARELTIDLLKQWLVRYKFRNWHTHRSDPAKVGQSVTAEERQERAEQIARALGDNKRWHSHGRRISVPTLTKELRLEIDDYSSDVTLQQLIRSYNDVLTEYIARNNFPIFLHSRHTF